MEQILEQPTPHAIPREKHGEKTGALAAPPVAGYCVSCRARNVMQNPTIITTRQRQQALTGYCENCGTRMFKMGRT